MEYFVASIGGRYYQKSYQVNTPFYNPLSEDLPEVEIEVTDPAHPLFGRRFSLISMSRPPLGEAHAFVQYRDFMLLKIPVSATDFGPSQFSLSTKLSLPSLKAIIQLFKDCEELCHINLEKSTKACRPNFNKKSGKKS